MAVYLELLAGIYVSFENWKYFRSSSFAVYDPMDKTNVFQEILLQSDIRIEGKTGLFRTSPCPIS